MHFRPSFGKVGSEGIGFVQKKVIQLIREAFKTKNVPKTRKSQKSNSSHFKM